jgi:hypothetical protein
VEARDEVVDLETPGLVTAVVVRKVWEKAEPSGQREREKPEAQEGQAKESSREAERQRAERWC